MVLNDLEIIFLKKLSLRTEATEINDIIFLKKEFDLFFFGKTFFIKDNILFAYSSDINKWVNFLLDKNKKYLNDKKNIISNFLDSDLPTLGDRREMKKEEWYDYFGEIWDKAILYNLNNDKSI